MRLKALLMVALGAAGVFCSAARADIVGYVNVPFQPGSTLFVNPLDTEGVNGNHLSGIIPAPPEGTTVSFWNPPTQSFNVTATFSSGLWDNDLDMPVGKAAKLWNPSSSSFVNTFVGYVAYPDGNRAKDENFGNHLPAPIEANGIYLLGSATPIALSGIDVFRWIVGRLPRSGEEFKLAGMQTITYDPDDLGYENWYPLSPTLAVGQAAFFNLGPIPEPATLSLLALGGLAMIRRRRSFAKPSL